MAHPNKHIRAAVEYAVNNGWRVVEGAGDGFIVHMRLAKAANSRFGRRLAARKVMPDTFVGKWIDAHTLDEEQQNGGF